MKRLFDFTVSLAGIVGSLPLWLLCAFAVWLEDFGPVFYVQKRVGKSGSFFQGIKFRSMVADSDLRFGPAQARESDGRVTRVGAFLRSAALDELPQLLNILKGEMSFVGPRALVPEEQEVGDSQVRSIFSFAGFAERSSVVPGLTGIAQIFAPRDCPRQRKFQYDIWYVRNRSFPLDLYLFFLSFLVTFKGRWEIRQDKFRGRSTALKYKIEKELEAIN